MQEISRMKSLVQEMLDLSRAEQVDVHYANETTKGKEVTYQVYNNFKILYPDYVITLDDDLTKEVTLQIYRNHFEQLIIIILDNAVKYSTTRKEVHISISSTLNEFEIAIQDFGEGIPKKTLIRSSIVFIEWIKQELERRVEMVWGCLSLNNWLKTIKDVS